MSLAHHAAVARPLTVHGLSTPMFWPLGRRNTSAPSHDAHDPTQGHQGHHRPSHTAQRHSSTRLFRSIEPHQVLVRIRRFHSVNNGFTYVGGDRRPECPEKHHQTPPSVFTMVGQPRRPLVARPGALYRPSPSLPHHFRARRPHARYSHARSASMMLRIIPPLFPRWKLPCRCTPHIHVIRINKISVATSRLASPRLASVYSSPLFDSNCPLSPLFLAMLIDYTPYCFDLILLLRRSRLALIPVRFLSSLSVSPSLLHVGFPMYTRLHHLLPCHMRQP